MHTSKLLLIVYVLSMICCSSKSARILSIVPSASISHQIVFRPIWHRLASKGHDITLLTTHPENQTNNINEIYLTYPRNIWESTMEQFVANGNNPFGLGRLMRRQILEITEAVFQQQNVKDILNNDKLTYDLVICEVYYEAVYAVAKRFNCPLIGLISLEINNNMHSIFGSASHPVLYPDIFFAPQSDHLDFWDRLKSLLFAFLFKLGQQTDYQADHFETKLLKKYLGIYHQFDTTDLMSMVLINSVPSLSTRAIGPALVNIGGGLHIQPAKKLPQDLGEYLDTAKDGFIYISLGTNVKSNMINPKIQKIILDACADLPYKVLWKFDIDLQDVPANVKLARWVPQQDVLRHPKIKAFVFQGGLQSSEETILFHVPIVGIPFMADQRSNIRKMVQNGIGVQLDKDKMDKDTLKSAILEVIGNPSYKQKAVDVARLMSDQPMSGVEKAVWWTEYVIRHKGAPHLREKSNTIPFYQYYLLDVIGFLLTLTVLAILILYKLFVNTLYCIRVLHRMRYKKVKSS